MKNHIQVVIALPTSDLGLALIVKRVNVLWVNAVGFGSSQRWYVVDARNGILLTFLWSWLLISSCLNVLARTETGSNGCRLSVFPSPTFRGPSRGPAPSEP
jgi:hypothetical protein